MRNNNNRYASAVGTNYKIEYDATNQQWVGSFNDKPSIRFSAKIKIAVFQQMLEHSQKAKENQS